MKTLDEVIKALEICGQTDINRSCKDCPYPDDQMCINYLQNDALHYLTIYKMCVESERKARIANREYNSPLTWDELKELIDKPVWIYELWEWNDSWSGSWRIISDVGEYIEGEGAVYTKEDDVYDQDEMGKTWIAYRKEREHADEAGNVSPSEKA